MGWTGGHSYIVYGPLINRNTTIIFEGKPIELLMLVHFGVLLGTQSKNIMFTAPTAIRAIKRGSKWRIYQTI